MKSKLLIIFSICISTLYAEENTYIKQQVAYKDPGASGKELTWDFGMLSPINEEYTVAYSIPDSNYMHQWCATEHRTATITPSPQTPFGARGMKIQPPSCNTPSPKRSCAYHCSMVIPSLLPLQPKASTVIAYQ